MTPATTYPAQNQNWFTRTENWLNSKGKGAWIAVMVLGFVFFWPLGLAILFYMIWGNKVFSKSCKTAPMRMNRASSGNTAFDAYKADT
ncbi:MAG: DUF2852 domain-containing protein, partial [Planktomarina sp.]